MNDRETGNKKIDAVGGNQQHQSCVDGTAMHFNTKDHSTTRNGAGQSPILDQVGALTPGARTLVNPNAIPHELRPYKQSVCWKLEDRGKPKPDKVPVNPRKPQSNAGATWPNTWADLPTAVNTYRTNENLAGVGFVLTTNDPYVMIDLDDCILYGKPNEFACNVLNSLGTYAELSPSGRGLRLFVQCRQQPNAIKRPEIELYSNGRFATLTGDVLDDRPIARFDSLDCFIDQFVPKPEIPTNSDPHSSSCAERVAPSGDDAELWSYIFRINSMARAIYNGDLSNVRGGDQSRAVILLLNSLALHTGGDAGRMKSMIRQTHLDQSKFEAKRGAQTWLDVQIQDAISYMAARGAK